MKYFEPILQNETLSKPKEELLQKKKQEYKLVGSFMRTPGLQLFSYNPATEALKKVIIAKSTTMHTEVISGELVPVDKEIQKVFINTQCIFFEALNYSNAERRLKRYRNGLIKCLDNLKEVRETVIKFY